jgi:hypothetical protein
MGGDASTGAEGDATGAEDEASDDPLKNLLQNPGAEEAAAMGLSGLIFGGGSKSSIGGADTAPTSVS